MFNETVHGEMFTVTSRRMGVPDAEVRMVEGTYKQTKGRVACGLGRSEEFGGKVGLRYGSVLSPLLFIAVVEVIRRKNNRRKCFFLRK